MYQAAAQFSAPGSEKFCAFYRQPGQPHDIQAELLQLTSSAGLFFQEFLKGVGQVLPWQLLS